MVFGGPEPARKLLGSRFLIYIYMSPGKSVWILYDTRWAVAIKRSTICVEHFYMVRAVPYWAKRATRALGVEFFRGRFTGGTGC